MKKIGKFFKNLFKCSFKEIMSLILDVLCYVLSFPSLFINFFIIFFLANSEMSAQQKGSSLIIIAIFLILWLWINNILKRDMLEYKQPYEHLIIRMLYKSRYIFIIAIILYLYTIKVDYTQVLIYLGTCAGTYSLSILCRAIWLKLNNKDWDFEYSKRTYKF